MVHVPLRMVIGCLLPAVAVACPLAAAVTTQPVEPPQADHAALIRRLEAIESRIDVLESGRGADHITARRAAEIRAMVSDVLAEAEVRTAMLAEDLTAGWDDGFFIQSPDGDFRLELTGQIQVRFVWNRRHDPPGQDTTEGTEIRRAKIKLDGHLITPELGYTVGLAKRSRSSEFVLQSFNIRYRLSQQLTALIGRARPPLLREEQISSKRQLAVERSLVARAFRQTRTVGAMMRYRTDRVRLAVGVLDGGVGNLDPSEADPDAGVPGDDRWRASTRLEYLFTGRWKDLDDFTSFPGERPLVAIGAGLQYQWEDLFDPALNDTQLIRWTADLTVDLGGANFFVAYVGSRTDQDNDPTLNQLGVVIQGGVFIGEAWELFGRYEYGDDDMPGGLLSVVTAGFNRYFAEHALKLTADVGYGFKPVADFWASLGAGWLEDEPGESGQIVVRVQIQLLF